MPVFRRGTFSSQLRARKEIKNIVLFGETGVGKSSLINLIADERIAETSSNAVGCTLDYKRYSLKIEDQHFAIWDTAGLDEGTQGTVPAEKAEAYLKQLLRDLAKANSVDLLIYCVRGTRVRSALLANYHLFYSAICRKKVPIAVVITGLENQEGNMDTWWLQNEKHFSALRMHFNSYACVTTLPSSADNPTLKERRKISRTAVNKMITSTCRKERWMPTERSWINTVFSDIHGILSRREGSPHVATVIMCDISRSSPVAPGVIRRSINFQSPVVLSPSCTRPMRLRNPVLIADGSSQSKLPFDEAIKCTPERLFRVYQVPRREALSKDPDEEAKMDVVVKRGADLLIFCVEKGGDRSHVKSQWEYFNFTYGGDLSPRIVIVIGAADPGSAEEWWRDTVGRAVTKNDVSIAYWRTNKTPGGAEAAVKRQLRDLINTCCIDCSKVSFERDEEIFKKDVSPRLDKTRVMSLWMGLPASDAGKSERNTTVVDQDVLTEWGVWEHVQAERNTTTKASIR